METGTWQQPCRDLAQAVRRRALAHAIARGGGYLSQVCSAAEVLATLYSRVMRLGPSVAPLSPVGFRGAPGPGHPTVTGADYNGPRAPDLDRFVFSPAPWALVLYSTLIETGRLALSALDQYDVDGGTVDLVGAEHSPGHEVGTGSPGQALGQAGGIAVGRRLRGETGHVWVFLSDDELESGSTWEAFAAVSGHRLDNLGVYVDVGQRPGDDPLAEVMAIGALAARLSGFGADVHEVDGHDVDALAAPAARRRPGRPLVVLARTDPCHGAELLRGRAPRLHYLRLGDPRERSLYEDLLARMNAGEGGLHGAG